MTEQNPFELQATVDLEDLACQLGRLGHEQLFEFIKGLDAFAGDWNFTTMLFEYFKSEMQNVKEEEFIDERGVEGSSNAPFSRVDQAFETWWEQEVNWTRDECAVKRLTRTAWHNGAYRAMMNAATNKGGL